MDDDSLRQILEENQPPKKSKEEKKKRPEPDWEKVHKELKKKGVTLVLLWEEYKSDHPDGYQSTQFNERYNKWKNNQEISLRQEHKAGEKLFVDYSGQTIPVIDRNTGKTIEAQIRHRESTTRIGGDSS